MRAQDTSLREGFTQNYCRQAGLSLGKFVDSCAANRCIAAHSTMNNNHNKLLFWGCFIALITTSYAFISRMILCGGQFVTDFGLAKVSVGELQGAGIWPFGV